MTNYYPFLKLKLNEILCLGNLSPAVISQIRPFFDVPRTSKNQNEMEILERIRIGLEKMDSIQKSIGNFPFYIDNFDLDDDIDLLKCDQYRYILNVFKKYRAIPVTAFDRNDNHNKVVYEYLEDVGGPVAVRLQLEDIDSWVLAKRKLQKLWKNIQATGTQHIDVFIDTRVITEYERNTLLINAFLKNFLAEFPCRIVVTTGSTIPSNISDIVETASTKIVDRLEYHIWSNLVKNKELSDVKFGDYGIVSPEYSDVDLDPKLFRTISTPRAFYPFGDKMIVVRGSSFKTHPTGNGQYYEIADYIQKQYFFRGETYSAGDKYIHERSSNSKKLPPKAGSPGSWVKSTLASHITYICNTINK